MTDFPSDAWLRRLPKIDLHVHLDGSLRPRLLWDILTREGKNPFGDLSELERRVRVPECVAHLSAYLDCFEFVLEHLQEPEDIERAAYELAEDSARENIRYLEARFSPILHLRRSATIADIINAAIRGLKRAELNLPIKTGLIVCCIREQDPSLSTRLAREATRYTSEGVVGVDLAGDEYHFPGTLHQEAFDIVHRAGVPITVHAGEVKGADSIREARDKLHARRIGHGLHLEDDPNLAKRFAEEKIPLEMCLTTNVHTKAVRTFGDHPAGRYLQAGIAVTLNTDDRLMSGTTLTDELIRARDHLSLPAAAFGELVLNAAAAAFLPPAEKRELLSSLQKEMNPIFNNLKGER